MAEYFFMSIYDVLNVNANLEDRRDELMEAVL